MGDLDLKRLAAPFEPNDVDWRVQASGKRDDGAWWVRMVPYIDARAIQQRFDDVLGAENWQVEYKSNPTSNEVGGLLCGISIYVGGRWVMKWDGAGAMDSGSTGGGLSAGDAMKGSISTAFKRAAVVWGVGRYLYALPASYGTVLSEADAKRHQSRVLQVEVKDKKNRDARPERVWVLPPPLPGSVSRAHIQQRDQRREAAIGAGNDRR